MVVRGRYDPPGWVRPERLPADLPPQEQWAQPEPEVMGAPAKHPPQTAPGFERARRMGLLPAPPPERPPTPLPGLSAGQRLGAAGLVFVSPLALVPFVQTNSPLAFVIMTYGVASFFVALKLLGSYVARLEVEAAAGYTTTWGSPGLWRLTPFGRVVREPDRRYLPDGFYPSPYWPGILQKWEGAGWKPLMQWWWRKPRQYFRTPDVPYLD